MLTVDIERDAAHAESDCEDVTRRELRCLTLGENCTLGEMANIRSPLFFIERVT